MKYLIDYKNDIFRFFSFKICKCMQCILVVYNSNTLHIQFLLASQHVLLSAYVFFSAPTESSNCWHVHGHSLELWSTANSYASFSIVVNEGKMPSFPLPLATWSGQEGWHWTHEIGGAGPATHQLEHMGEHQSGVGDRHGSASPMEERAGVQHLAPPSYAMWRHGWGKYGFLSPFAKCHSWRPEKNLPYPSPTAGIEKVDHMSCLGKTVQHALEGVRAETVALLVACCTGWGD